MSTGMIGTTAGRDDREMSAAYNGDRGRATGARPVSWTDRVREEWELARQQWADELEAYCNGYLLNARGQLAKSEGRLDVDRWLRGPRRDFLAYASEEAREWEQDRPRPLWTEWLERARNDRYLENETHVDMIREHMTRMRELERELKDYLARDLGDMVHELRTHGVEWGELEELTGKTRKALDDKRKAHIRGRN